MRHPAPFARYAAHMLDGGYSPIPVRWADKRPLARVRDETCPDPLVLYGVVNGWDRLRTETLTPADIAEIVRRRSRIGIGVVGGYNGLVPIDCDTDDPAIAKAILSALPRAIVGKRGQRGLVRFYRSDVAIPARKFRMPPVDGKPGGVLVEVLTTGKTVTPPSIHPDTQEPYRWLTRSTLYSKRVDELVTITPAHIEALAEALRPWVPLPKPYVPRPPGPRASDSRMRAYASAVLAKLCCELAGMRRDSGRNIALHTAGLKLSPYVCHDVLGPGEVEAALIAACRANGLLKEDGMRCCLGTIHQGIRKARRKDLPMLGA